jgi:DNA primase
MSNGDPKDAATFREVAAELQAIFYIEAGGTPKGKQPKIEPERELPVVINAPLDFELKGLDAEHPYLLNRGFTPETMEHFGLGFCSRGLLKGRLAIPLQDHCGQIIGYAGLGLSHYCGS